MWCTQARGDTHLRELEVERAGKASYFGRIDMWYCTRHQYNLIIYLWNLSRGHIGDPTEKALLSKFDLGLWICKSQTVILVKTRKRECRWINDIIFSMASELMPKIQNEGDVAHHSMLLKEPHKYTQTLSIGKSGKSFRNVRGGIIVPSLIIFITVSSPLVVGRWG